jgi:hypothetical protein
VAAVGLAAAGVAAGVAVLLQPLNATAATITTTRKTMARDFFITLLLNLFANESRYSHNNYGEGLIHAFCLTTNPLSHIRRLERNPTRYDRYGPYMVLSGQTLLPHFLAERPVTFPTEFLLRAIR